MSETLRTDVVNAVNASSARRDVADPFFHRYVGRVTVGFRSLVTCMHPR